MDLGDYNKYFEWLKENGFDSEHTIPKEHFDQINNIFFNINSKKIKNIDAYKKAIGEVNSLQKMINRLPPQKAGTQRYVSDNARKLRKKVKSSARTLLEKQCTELEIKVLELKQKIQESVIPVRDRLDFFINNRYDYLDSDLTNLESIYSNYLHKASEFQKELRNVNCKIVEISKLTPKPGKAPLDKVKKIKKSINSLYQMIPIGPFTKKFKIATKDLERHILNKGRIVAYKKSVDSFLSKTPDISKIENLIEKINNDSRSLPGFKSIFEDCRLSAEIALRKEMRKHEIVKKHQLQKRKKKKPGTQNTNIFLDSKNLPTDAEKIALFFYDYCIKIIDNRRYGLPENCNVTIDIPEIKNIYSHAHLFETSDGLIYANVVGYDGSSFTLYPTGDKIRGSMFLLQVYLLCVIADIVTNKSEKKTVKSDRYDNDTNNQGKTSNNTLIRHYPRMGNSNPAGSLGKISGKSQPVPSYVVWHLRRISGEPSSEAKINALLYAGIENIPKGFTFVSPYWKGLKKGESTPQIEIKSQLALSFLKSMGFVDSIAKK